MHTYKDGNKAMLQYYMVTGKKVPPLEHPFILSNFYTHSNAQKDREIAFIVLGTAVTGHVADKLL